MARIEAQVGGGGTAEPSIDEVSCPSAAEVGHWVFISGSPVGGRFSVDVVDPLDPARLPAVGIIIEKLTTTTAKMQWGGKCEGILSGLAPGYIIYVGADGKSTHTPLPQCEQPVGVAFSETVLEVAPDWSDIPIPSYASHLGTSDGSTNGTVPFPTTTNGYVSEPTSDGNPFSSYSQSGDWANPNAYHPGVRLSSAIVSTVEEVTDLDPGTTLTLEIMKYTGPGTGETLLVNESILCNGTDQDSTPNGYLSTVGIVANAGHYEGVVQASLPFSALLPGGGYVRVRIRHDGAAGGPYQVEWEAFIDYPHATPPTPAGLGVAENVAVLKYLSGIRFYDLGSTFYVDGIINDVFKAMYHPTPILLDLSGLGISTPTSIGYTDSAISPSHPPTPKWNDGFVWLKSLAINTSNFRSLDATGRQRGRDPFGVSAYQYSASGPIMIDTVPAASTDTYERFADENYRLVPRATWLTTPACPPTGGDKFNSVLPLDNGVNQGAQVINDSLIYPMTDFTSPAGRRPVQQAGTNYALMTGVRTYHRPFQHDTTPGTRSNIILHLPGLSCIAGDIDPGGTGDLNMFIMVPTVSAVWFDCGKNYFSASFPSPDPGCFVQSLSGVAGGLPSNEYFYFTFGLYSTTPTERTIVLRVDYRTTATPVLTRIRAHNWT